MQYEFESYDNMFSGEVKILTGNGSNGRILGYVGNSVNNRVTVPVEVFAGTYRIDIKYFCDGTRPLIVDVNGTIVSNGSVPSSGGWNSVATKSIEVTLNDGVNLISVYSVDGYAPDLDCLQPIPVA